jgi:CheY-like chemotaxis protein
MSAKTILYVEDNEVNRRLVQDLLMSATYPSPSPECGEPTT